MGSPVIVNDGSPVKITWFDDEGWDLDEKTQTLTKLGKYRVSAALFNLIHHVKFETPPTLRINFTSGREHATLLVTTGEDRSSLRLQIANLPEGRKFSDFFAPPDEDF